MLPSLQVLKIHPKLCPQRASFSREQSSRKYRGLSVHTSVYKLHCPSTLLPLRLICKEAAEILSASSVVCDQNSSQYHVSDFLWGYDSIN